MTDVKSRSLEDRIQRIEDHLEIINLVAGHPPGADSASRDYAASFWTEDGTIDMGREGVPPAGFESMMTILTAPGFKEAQRQGICHFVGPPHVTIDGDTAIATSYLQILAADPDGKSFELSAHGTSKGFRVCRLSANRWELVCTDEGWRIKSRTIRSMDTPGARELLGRVAASA